MRHALAAIAAVLVLAAAVGGAYWLLDQESEVAADLADPSDTVTTYLRAWEDGDHETMAALVRDAPERFVADHEQLREGLQVQNLTAELVELTTDVDGRAAAEVAATVEAGDGVGELSWTVTVRLLRERGDWGIAWSPEAFHPAWQPGLRFDLLREDADRAPILALDGTPLAGPSERVTYGFDPADVDDAGALAEAFDVAVDGSGDTVRRLYDDGGLVEGWFYPVTSLPTADAREATTELRGVPGVLRRTEDGARSLLADGFALHLVGRVDAATAEQLEELGPPYEAGDEVGQFGLEAALEPRLAASERVSAVLRDGASGPVRTTLAQQRRGVDGEVVGDDDVGPLTTTIEVAVQRAVENTLLARDTPTGLVAVDAGDGAIRASASRPLTGFDRALTGRYAPGPVIGPVIAEAQAASGDDRPDADALVAAAERLGVGRDLQLPVPAFAGSLPTPVDVAEARRVAEGQGRAEVSVLQAASFAAISVDGAWHAPYLLEADGPSDPVTLSGGAVDRLQQRLDDGEASGLRVAAGAADGTGGTPLGWAYGTVDGLGFAVLLEGGDGDEALLLAERFAREVLASRDRAVDLTDDAANDADDADDADEADDADDADDEPPGA